MVGNPTDLQNTSRDHVTMSGGALHNASQGILRMTGGGGNVSGPGLFMGRTIFTGQNFRIDKSLLSSKLALDKHADMRMAHSSAGARSAQPGGARDTGVDADKPADVK
ncbi:hypothetical protein AC579_896 [Pseudocercospora musae]|uniref:Uncharacterized protein n=1 Tax=Pseudocercospora musae TaxID=113226 RepID=A0A139IMX2_9PEZI|nr:hypothetical protein AC579_896 [Pseudocercospora musae]